MLLLFDVVQDAIPEHEELGATGALGAMYRMEYSIIHREVDA